MCANRPAAYRHIDIKTDRQIVQSSDRAIVRLPRRHRHRHRQIVDIDVRNIFSVFGFQFRFD